MLTDYPRRSAEWLATGGAVRPAPTSPHLEPAYRLSVLRPLILASVDRGEPIRWAHFSDRELAAVIRTIRYPHVRALAQREQRRRTP